MEGSIAKTRTGPLRFDLQLIADMIARDSRVLDVGCGDGVLLDYLAREKGVDARGIEIRQEGVHACVKRGLSVIQGDADTDLADYPANAFDYVVLSKTLQATYDPRGALQQMARIGRRVVVSFVNYGHWRTRLALVLTGRVPVTGGNGLHWYDSPDIHLCTILDFVDLTRELGLEIEQALSFGRTGKLHPIRSIGPWANLTGEQAVFLLRRG